MKHFIFTTILFATLLMANALQFQQCNGNYPNPIDVTMLPDSPIFGQSVELFMSTIAHTTVEVGAYVYILINNPTWVIPFTYRQDICNENYITNCPISNYFSYNYTYYFYNSNEPLTVNAKAMLMNPDDTILSCVQGDVTIQASVV
ncbi:hypothetical protein RclHR1_06710010 [Rhizophagus clarus]|uniref:Phosphatidylglycerol/phosphatidylinositol transfer protein n=1 Tax=Rhizophagus clarus TaxID=94130 RepID=A0A2Z6S9Q9_9GLOM|nr:hypothetical protein RclHR1_06710010 [Rhizophagus clarus]GES73183.1 hypothetical protein GLOIN_2v1632724 [Rhizophagus clarus]